MTEAFVSLHDKFVRQARRILAGTVVVFVVLSLVMTVVNGLSSYRQIALSMKTGLERKGITLTVNNSIALRGMAEDNAFLAMRELVSATVAQDSDVVTGTYLGEDGTIWVLVHRGNPDGGVAAPFVPRDSVSRWALSVTAPSLTGAVGRLDETIHFAAPVLAEDGSRLGTILYGLSTEAMREAVAGMVWGVIARSALLAAGLLVLVVALFFIQSRMVRSQTERIVLPIRELTKTAADIAGGNYDSLVSPSSNDEIGELARSFEIMRLTVKEYTHDLEARVAERTQQLGLLTEELKRSNTELEQFAYVASHDLQEPLRMVGSYLGLIDRRYRDKLDQDGHEFIAFAVDGAARMRQLINDLLMYSRVGTKAKSYVPTDLGNVAATAIRNLQVAIEEKKAVVAQDGLPCVLGDEGQLVQLLQNLIGNAIKFCKDRNPEVRVEAVRRDTMWEISVMDNGVGIAPEHLDRIFQIFQRLHSREEYEGTGIGLAVCKRIVERHGGRIWAESQPGKGTALRFTLPECSDVPPPVVG